MAIDPPTRNKRKRAKEEKAHFIGTAIATFDASSVLRAFPLLSLSYQQKAKGKCERGGGKEQIEEEEAGRVESKTFKEMAFIKPPVTQN